MRGHSTIVATPASTASAAIVVARDSQRIGRTLAQSSGVGPNPVDQASGRLTAARRRPAGWPAPGPPQGATRSTTPAGNQPEVPDASSIRVQSPRSSTTATSTPAGTGADSVGGAPTESAVRSIAACITTAP